MVYVGESRRGGFTLVELLVVVSVISVLIAIMLPALSMIRQQAESTVCKSRLKEWGLILHVYTSENEDRLWLDTDSKDPWVNTLSMYTDLCEELCVCPSASDLAGDLVGGVENGWLVEEDQYIPYVTDKCSYGLNFWLLNQYSSREKAEKNRKRWKLMSMTNSDTPLFLDCASKGGYPESLDADPRFTGVPETGNWYQEYVRFRGGYDGNEMAKYCIPRHGESVNGVFADGSTASVALKDLWGVQWHKSFEKTSDVEIDWLD